MVNQLYYMNWLTNHSMKNFEKMDKTNEVITRIRSLIADGTYRPGIRLPSERVMAESMNTTRGYIRKALQKLEFYGILEIRPQSGVYIAEMGTAALDGLISNILTMDPQTTRDFIETRSHLEVFSARLASQRADSDHLAAIIQSHEAFITAFRNGEPTLEADHLFHITIAGASGNSVLRSLISLLTPDIIALNRDFVENRDERYRKTPEEHRRIVDAISSHDPEAASEAMRRHMEASWVRRMGENSE